MNKKIIEKLRDDEHYYGEFGRKFLSNSDIKTLFTDPDSFGKPVEKTVPMLVGGYLHTCILEPDKINNFKVIPTATRNNNKYKEISGGELCLLQHEVDKTLELRDRLLANTVCRELIHGTTEKANVIYEQPGIKELHGNMWKGKADIINHEERLIIDIKTTSDIEKFRWSANKFNYDSQAWIYKQMFGYDFLFIVIDKTSKKINIFECSDNFYMTGEDKVMKASDIYNLFFKTEGFEPQEYFETKTL